MPRMRGPELALHLDDQQPGIPVVLMQAGPSETEMEQMLTAEPAAGRHEIPQKPFTAAGLLSAVQAAMACRNNRPQC
jgi:FixJ family two-component response regulator